MVANITPPEMETNQKAFQNLVHDYEKLFIYSAEAQVLDRFRNDWKNFTVLDLGVGAGRTAWSFSRHALDYTGLDYAPEMIERCNGRLPVADHRRFVVGDARDLGRFPDQQFDFVLFSSNGLDYINHEDRDKALKEVLRTLKPGGWYFFSTHSLDAFPFCQPHPRRLRGALTPVGWAYKMAIEQRMRWRNRLVNVAETKDRGWGYLYDFFEEVKTYYIKPKLQVQTLESLGFEFDSAWDCSGQPFDFSNSPEDWMIQFLFRKPAA